jgi:hypothetical protein
MKSKEHMGFWAPLTLREKAYIGFIGTGFVSLIVGGIGGLVWEIMLWLSLA